MAYKFATGSIDRGDIYYEDDTGKNTYLDWNEDELDIVVGGKSMIKMVEAATDKITINNGGSDVDLQIKSNNNANLIRTDGANDRVGVGTSAPVSTFDVSGSVGSSMISLTGTSNNIDETHHTVLMGSDDNDCTVQLPSASTCTGRIYIFKSLASTATIRITPDGDDPIDGRAESWPLDTQYNVLTIQSDGGKWWILNEVHMGEG